MSEGTRIHEEFLFLGDESPAADKSATGSRWKIMIVDDEEDVHAVTRMVLADLVFEGMGVEFLSAHSGEEAMQHLKEHPDTAIVLLDVVMERDDAGLALVRHIREDLGNSSVRIILRTGLPGMAPVEKVIIDYDINDYTEKTDLTAQKLFTVIISALRSYRDIVKAGELAEQLRREIAERRNAEAQLIASEVRYSSIFTNIGIGIAVISPEMEILYMNPVMERAYPQIDVGQHPICYKSFNTPPGEGACSYCPTIRAFMDGQIHISVTDTPTPHGIRHFRIIAAPVMSADGTVSAVTEAVEDITDKRKVEEEILRSQKLESVGLLAGGIAHDFNNLLTAVLGNISLAKALLPKEDRSQPRLTEAEKATIRARDLTRQLLTFAKGGAPVRRSASIGDLIRETTGFALSGSKVRCALEISPDLSPVEIDQGQISQVMHNLIINADQAMPLGGVLGISCSESTLADGDVPQLKGGRYVRISVSDQGVGIAAEHLQRIFDPYFTTKEKGRGLGLATAYSIIRNHDGAMEVSSTPGAGTTFTVYLPVSSGAVVPAGGEEGRIIKGKGKVLVLDDEEAVLETAAEILSYLGYETDCVSNSEDAIRRYRNGKDSGDSFSAVIADLTIPGGMGGKEMLEILREFDPGIRVIVSSGYSNDPIMSEYRKHGFRGVICKPYLVEELSKVLGELLAQE